MPDEQNRRRALRLRPLQSWYASGCQMLFDDVGLTHSRSSKTALASDGKARETPKPKLQSVQPHQPTETPTSLYRGLHMVRS